MALLATEGAPFFEEVRKKELVEIRDKLISSALAGDPVNVWVIGEFGVGKSVLMSYVQSMINTRFKDDMLATFVLAPNAGITGIYDDAIADLRKTGALDRAISKVLIRILNSREGLIHGKKSEMKKIQQSLGENIETYRELAKTEVLVIKELVDAVIKEIRAKFPYVETKILSLIFQYVQDPEEAWTRLKGLRQTERLAGLVTLIHFLHFGGYKMICLFIDQLELGWLKWTRMQKDRFAIDVRELVVRTKPFLSVGVIANSDIMSDIETNYPTLLRPLPLNEERTVTVRKFSFTEVTKLVEWYLSQTRISKAEMGLAPFDEAAIRQIYEKMIRNTDRILVCCFDVLRFAAQNGVKAITAEVVQSRLKETLSAGLNANNKALSTSG